MNTTFPKRWKAEAFKSSEIIEGKSLTTLGNGRYGISQKSAVEIVLVPRYYKCYDPLVGIEIKSETIFWMCKLCNHWNHRKRIKCNNCNAILDKFKDDKNV